VIRTLHLDGFSAQAVHRRAHFQDADRTPGWMIVRGPLAPWLSVVDHRCVNLLAHPLHGWDPSSDVVSGRTWTHYTGRIMREFELASPPDAEDSGPRTRDAGSAEVGQKCTSVREAFDTDGCGSTFWPAPRSSTSYPSFSEFESTEVQEESSAPHQRRSGGVVAKDLTYLGDEKLRELLREGVMQVLYERKGSCPMCDLCNEDSSVRSIAYSMCLLEGASTRKGYILRQIKEKCPNITFISTHPHGTRTNPMMTITQ
jgi:hypothetical protein